MPTITVFGVLAAAGLVEHVGAHEEVVEVEVGRAAPVGADAADPGGEVDDEVGVDVVEEADGVVGSAQVVLGAAGGGHERRLAGSQPARAPPDRGSPTRR